MSDDLKKAKIDKLIDSSARGAGLDAEKLKAEARKKRGPLSQEGVHPSADPKNPGISYAGEALRERNTKAAKEEHKEIIKALMRSNTPNIPKPPQGEELDKAKIYDFKTGKMIADHGQPAFTTPPRGNLKAVTGGQASSPLDVKPKPGYTHHLNDDRLPSQIPHAETLEALKARFGNQHTPVHEAIDRLQLGHDEPYAFGDTHNVVWGGAHNAKSREGAWNRPIPLPSYNVDPKGVLGKGVPSATGSDPFMWMDAKYGAAKKVLQEHKDKPLQIHTRSDLIARDDYMNALNPKLHEINMHLSTENESLNRRLEPGAPSAKRRLAAVQKLRDAGFKVNLVHDNLQHKYMPPEFQKEFNLRHVAEALGVPYKNNIIKLNNKMAHNIEKVTGRAFMKPLTEDQIWGTLKPLSSDDKANKSEGLEKGKNVREQKKAVFGTQSRPSGAMREKHMAAIKDFFEKRYGIAPRVTPGKLNAMGKPIDKPDWKSGHFEYQGNPEAAVHEGGHFEQMPIGTTMEEHQAQMDRNFGIANRDFGYLSGKQTQFEIQPMAAENLLRRRMGLPATTIGHKTTEGAPPRMARDTGTPSAVRVKDAKGVVRDLIRQSRLLTPENREQTEMIDRGELKYEPSVGLIPGSSIDSRINQAAREAAKQPGRKDTKTLLRSELDKAANLKLAGAHGVHLGNTAKGKPVFSHGMVGEYPNFSSQDHSDAAYLHQQAANKAKDHESQARHSDKAKLHMAAATRLESKKKGLTPATAGVAPARYGKLHDPSMSGKVNKSTMTAPARPASPPESNKGIIVTPTTLKTPTLVQGDDSHKKVLGNLMSKLKNLKRS